MPRASANLYMMKEFARSKIDGLWLEYQKSGRVKREASPKGRREEDKNRKEELGEIGDHLSML